jgi:hypothetical protein
MAKSARVRFPYPLPFPPNSLKMHTQSFIQYVNANRVLYDRVLASLNPVDIFRYSRTCRMANEAVSSYFDRVFDLPRHLRRFFSSPANFRTVLRKTGALISGTFAALFFDRTIRSHRLLDIYVQHKHANSVVHWLLHNGYDFRPRVHEQMSLEIAINHMHNCAQHPHRSILHGIFSNLYPTPGLLSSFDFVRNEQNKPKTFVRVAVASNTPLELVLHSHSSESTIYVPPKLTNLAFEAGMMNIISPDKAYAFYPYETFQDHRSLICGSLHPKMRRERKKFEEHGWCLETCNDPSSISYSCGIRRIGDNSTWTIPLWPRDDVNPEVFAQTENMEMHSWHLVHKTTHPFYRDAAPAYVYFEILSSPLLRYNYVLGDGKLYSLLEKMLLHANQNQIYDTSSNK